MLAPVTPTLTEQASTRQDLLPAEMDFYSAYDWCLDPHLTVCETIEHLHDEIGKLETVPEGWQIGEVATNVFLLSCALLNAIDEYLRGTTLRMPGRLAAVGVGRGARAVADKIMRNLRRQRLERARRWRERWHAGLDDFLAIFTASRPSDRMSLVEPGRRLAILLRSSLPPDLKVERIGAPSPFRRLDLTHFDILALGQRFVTRFPDRSQQILLLGLRTSGSYFAPLLRAFLKSEGYRSVSSLTVHPRKGPDDLERRAMKRYAERGYTAVIVDDPPHTGGTVALALDIALRAGFTRGKVLALLPAHPARRKWSGLLPEDLVVSLEPEQWHKHRLLDSNVVEARLAEYFERRNFADISLVASSRAEEFNVCMQNFSGERGDRLKRIYEVHLQTSQGQKETRYILAKSVGWGWLGYHAFLAGYRLSSSVPPIVGLRDGILYMQWFPQLSHARHESDERDERIDTSAAYVAARVRCLNLRAHTRSDKTLETHQNGLGLLEKVLSRAYGRFLTDTLARPHLQRRLSQQPCPLPTLIDGKMGRAEWIVGPHGLLKADFEHHGMGKSELNVVDPAYDLAEVILDLALSPEEESRLIRRYVEETGDSGVEQRLFMNKLLAGFWAMGAAQEHLFGKPRIADRQKEFHDRYMNAWNFLTVHTARLCGSHCSPPRYPGWHSPLVALDIDGVLDRRLFGFPCTTLAGIKALSILNAHEFCVALNTARSIAELKDYCKAYSLAGGIAEQGSYLWDAVAQRGRVLISREAMAQLDELRNKLRRLPGVFLDDRHQYSIRAFTYQDKPRGFLSSLLRSFRSFSVGVGAPAPLPTLVMHHLITALGLDQLSFHHTTIDTTIVAKSVDKGAGLLALRDWVLAPEAETIAVGDSETDLPMFRVATRSFAPANIGCGRQARLLGCQIVRHPYQRGLLDIARRLAHLGGRPCGRCVECEAIPPSGEGLFLELLRAADQRGLTRLIGTLSHPTAFRIFLH